MPATIYMTMLDERKTLILRAVVEEYIETAQPVGSSWVARLPGMGVSPATIRKEMMALEQDGFLTQPHTSAGRIPTDMGYRFFVDSLTASNGASGLDDVRSEEIKAFFARTRGAIEVMLHGTSRLLADLTDYASVVIGPPHEDAVIKSAQIVPLGDRSAIVVIVLSSGAIERAPLEIDDGADQEVVELASRFLSEKLVGRTLKQGVSTKPTSLPEDAAANRLCQTALKAISTSRDGSSDQIYVGGASRMAQAFDAVETVRQVLNTLEQQYIVVSLLQDVLDRGLNVAIGHEHGIEPLSNCSVVVSPYEVDGERAGLIGVFGPTRMHYPEALTAVALVGQSLGRRLSEN